MFTLLSPHRTAEILLRVNDFVVSTVDVQASPLHLTPLFAHHVGRLGFVLVCLHQTLILVRVIVCDLVRLGESVVVGNSRSIVSETAEVWFRPLLLLNVHRDYFYLVVRQSDFNLKLVWHNKFVCLDGVVVILLLLNLLLLLKVAFLVDCSLDVVWVLHHLYSNSVKHSLECNTLLTCASSTGPGDSSAGASVCATAAGDSCSTGYSN